MDDRPDMNEFSAVLTDELEPMWRFALRLTANETDAEDLVQRTCVKALENAHQYQEQGRLRSWLFRIEHRIWLSVLRARQIRSAGSFKSAAVSDSHLQHSQQSASATDDPNHGAQKGHHELCIEFTPESQLRLHQIYLQVESLPDAQRLVVILVCVEGFTYQETAEILDIPIGTVMSRLARARITLGKVMLSANSAKPTADMDGGLR